jgi:hypothetical protein
MAHSLIKNNYYVIDVDHKYIQNYPKFILKYSLKNVVVRFVESYDIFETESYVFEHTMPDAHVMCIGLWTMIATNHSKENNFFYWTTHIYSDRFVVKKDITPLILKCIAKFKSLINKF